MYAVNVLVIVKQVTLELATHHLCVVCLPLVACEHTEAVRAAAGGALPGPQSRRAQLCSVHAGEALHLQERRWLSRVRALRLFMCSRACFGV